LAYFASRAEIGDFGLAVQLLSPTAKASWAVGCMKTLAWDRVAGLPAIWNGITPGATPVDTAPATCGVFVAAAGDGSQSSGSGGGSGGGGSGVGGGGSGGGAGTTTTTSHATTTVPPAAGPSCLFDQDPQNNNPGYCVCSGYPNELPTLAGTNSPCKYTALPTTTKAPPTNTNPYTYTDPNSNVLVCSTSTLANYAGYTVTQCAGGSKTIYTAPTPTPTLAASIGIGWWVECEPGGGDLGGTTGECNSQWGVFGYDGKSYNPCGGGALWSETWKYEDWHETNVPNYPVNLGPFTSGSNTGCTFTATSSSDQGSVKCENGLSATCSKGRNGQPSPWCNGAKNWLPQYKCG
jgi:hypothetical protein